MFVLKLVWEFVLLFFNSKLTLTGLLTGNLWEPNAANVSYECGFNYLPQEPSTVKLLIYHMKFPDDSSKSDELVFEQLDRDNLVEELKLSSVDPNLPYAFLIHGFNNRRYKTTEVGQMISEMAFTNIEVIDRSE